jgi:branched-chain amino acid transport system ATP-binding protein
VSEPAVSASPVIELEDVHVYYGAIQALKGISLTVRAGEIVTLIGANGAGKSTTLRAINGINKPRKGAIRFQGDDITGAAPHTIVKRGIAQSPEGTMSGGEQQMCAIGRALMARPKLLLLDEPSMGLAPIFVERIFETVVEVNRQGTPVLLVEQNALMALDVAHRGYVMETGRIPLEGPASELKSNEQVRKAYLGES